VGVRFGVLWIELVMVVMVLMVVMMVVSGGWWVGGLFELNGNE